MTGADLIRRRALGNIGARIIRNAREENLPTEQINAIYRELVFVSKATVDGETLYSRKRPDDTGQDLKDAQIDLSGFDAILDTLGAVRSKAAETRQESPRNTNHPHETAPETEPGSQKNPVYTLRYLMDDYFQHDGKNTGSDNRSNIERAVKMFEDLCPEVRTLAVTDISLDVWDRLHTFVQEIPDNRGRPSPENLVTFTRALQANGTDYPRCATCPPCAHAPQAACRPPCFETLCTQQDHLAPV